jgi:phage shock protein E
VEEMKTIFKLVITAITAMLLVGSLSGCSSTPALEMSEYVAVVDVRTPGEVAMGRLDTALHIDFQGNDFIGEISKLDKSANYYIYCRSGNRAGQAIALMVQEGFTGTLTNGGSLESAAAETGLQIVQN